MRDSLLMRPLLASVLVAQMALPASALAEGQQSMTQQEPSMQAQPQMESRMTPGMTAKPFVAGAQLKGDQLILQVLNRLSYGPRPGDLEKVRAMGVSTWIQRQLNPALIDDSGLEERLAAYPAMQMPLGRLMEMYPDGRLVKAAMRGNTSAPGGDAERAIYNNQMERYREKKKDGKDKAARRDDRQAAPLPMDASQIAAMPPDQRFKAICKLTIPQLRELRQSLSEQQREHLTDGFTPQQTEAIAAFSGPRAVIAAEDIQVKLLRDIYSERQLQEMMVDFWLNHFNVYMKKSQQAPYYIAEFEKRIRANAMGNFEKLLVATAMSPAMLNYLDNAQSIGPHSDFAMHPRQGPKAKDSGLNENYGRELMELHTVGVNGGYSQQDVTEVAKVFTGWTVGKGRGADTIAQPQFDYAKHEPGAKMVLGQKIGEDGEAEGLKVLHMLATSPQTARFISTKLAVRFVCDDPPKPLIDRMTSAFLASNGDIRRVLAAMITSPEFTSEGAYRSKVKTPQDYVVSAVRASGSDVQSAAALAEVVADLGMPLFGHQTPDGYSMKSEAWNSTAALVERMNFALALATNRVSGVTTDFTRLLGPDAGSLTPDTKLSGLENALLHVPVSDRTQALILAQTSQAPEDQAASLRQVSAMSGKRDVLAIRGMQRRPMLGPTTDSQAAMATGLIFGSPEFQRR